MKVMYPGPGGQTYHPKLGKLIADEPFDLDDEEAKKYVDSGLLRDESKELRAESEEQGAINKKNITVKVNGEEIEGHLEERPDGAHEGELVGSGRKKTEKRR